jgi:hypothetical protein
MASVALVMEKNLKEEPFLFEALTRKLINYGSLANELKPTIEKELGKEVKIAAIIMALRRLSEKNFSRKKRTTFQPKSELNIKTGLFDITFFRSTELVKKIPSAYSIVSFEEGGFLNIIQGSYEVNIISNEIYSEKIMSLFKGEKILNTEKNLVAVSMKFTKEFFYTPGIISSIISELAWHNINVFEAISTMTEFTVIVKKKDLLRTYETLDKLLSPTTKKEKK